MKLAILGASGGIGRLLVEQALARGHEVTAAARGSSRVTVPPKATLVRGDLEDEAFVREVITAGGKRDVVLSALGHRLPGIAPWHKPERPAFLQRSTDAIVGAMKATGVSRVIAISSGGVGDSRDIIPAAFKMFVALSAMKTVFASLEDMEQRYLASGLEVCIVRPSGLTDEPATGRVVIAKKYAGRATIPRADVAAYMLDQCEKPAFTEKTPSITVTGA
jgi:putative NADH-flavin reductase